MKFNIQLTLVCALALLPVQLISQIKDKPGARFSQSDDIYHTLININNMSMWVSADAKLANSPQRRPGATYPRGTGTVIYQDGLIWGGQVHDGEQPLVRVGGQQYNVGHVPGAIVTPGMAEDASSPQVNHVWRVRRDYFSADLRLDAAELLGKAPEEVTEAEIKQVRGQYAKDWFDWPWQKGAPFYDAEGDGVYQPQFNPDGSPVLFPEADEPGFANGDQVAWLVANDLDAFAVSNFSGSPPIGFEMQITLWGYSEGSAFRQAIFRRHRLIYKGTHLTPDTARIDSLYLGQWSDPDVGSSGDDLAGCDIPLDLAFAYNSQSSDVVFELYELPPPAVGYTLLAGPVRPGSFGRAIFDLRIRRGYDNLPMTSFIPFGALEGPLGTYDVTLQIYNMLRGYLPRPETPLIPIIDPTTDQPTKFAFSGDPIAGTGWVDQGSGDRRFLASTGPIAMARKDTQEVTIASIGGLGSDRLTSLVAVKHYTGVIRESFAHLLQLPQPPPEPSLSATALDGRILLNWSEDVEQVAIVENSESAGLRFEGYNVYQLPSAGAPLSEGIRLATFDLKNDVAGIVEQEFDPALGTTFDKLVQAASNTGIFRNYTVVRDSLHKEPLYNGQAYHFAVTAYNVNPDRTAFVRSLESEPAIVTVTPQSLAPGHRLRAGLADTIAVAHTQGIATGEVSAIVVDPTRITGHDYQVSFREVITEIDLWDPEHPDTTTAKVWDLIDLTAADTLLKSQTNFSGDEDYLIADGLQIKVMGTRLGIAANQHNEAAGMVEVAHGGTPLTPAQWDEAGAEFSGNTVWHDLNHAGAAEPYYVSAGGGAGNIERLARNIGNAVPFDFEMRLTSLEDGSFGWWVFVDNSAARVPFQLWNIGIATPDDPSDDVRLIPIHFSPEGETTWTLSYTDPALGCRHCSDWTYFYFDSRGYERYEEDARDGFVDDGSFGQIEYIARMVLCDVDSNGVAAPPGTVIRIHTTKPFSEDDVYTFSTADYAPAFSVEQARQDVEQVNVFPNPYVGIFSFETRFPGGL